ncbi:MAG: hypothetical protein KDA22_06625 [Phycisphaerales bacterium]|nr:hypothetical protein [Phycisphaerales bacterium]
MRCNLVSFVAASLLTTVPALGTTFDVDQVGLTFVPDTLTVAPGDTVVWHWHTFMHTVTSGSPCTPDGVYFNAPLDAGHPTFTWVVPDDASGEIPYFCIPHCGFDMIGLITVEPAAVPGDLNGDGIVDGADLGLLLAAWGTDDAAADLDGSGTVDGADLGLMLGLWT